MKYFYLALVFIAFLGCTKPHETIIELYAPNVPEDGTVYIVGGNSELGDWNPGAVNMENKGDGLWVIIISNDSQDVEYKYTLGSWEREAGISEVIPDGNRLAKGESKIIQDTVSFWLDRRGANPIVTGESRYHRQLSANDLLPRDVIVWLPPGYTENLETSYPVLYMHDGQNIIDPTTSAFGIDWGIDETADSLISNGIIDPMIVVGIYNTSDRTVDYSPGKKGEAYLDFVVYTVKPLIDSTYRTKPDRENTAVGGSSMGGIISFMFGWEAPEVFSKAICMSPAFKINDLDYVVTVYSDDGPRREVKFYIDNGGVGLEKRLQPGIDAMLKTLDKKGYVPHQDYFWVLDEKAEHNEAAWAKRMPEALTLLFGIK